MRHYALVVGVVFVACTVVSVAAAGPSTVGSLVLASGPSPFTSSACLATPAVGGTNYQNAEVEPCGSP
jgi:hypothetical protein